MLRFHLDANLPNALAEALAQRGLDVTTSPRLGMRTAKDEDQLAYAYRENRVLVTHDQDFLVLNNKGLKHAGIVYCQMRRRGIGRLVRKI